MNWIVLIYLLIYTIAVGGVIFVGFYLHLRKSAKDGDSSKISLNDITVLIPFRNEEDRLEGLLSSLKGSLNLPYRIIFIDDHSEDGSVDVIRKGLGELSHEIIAMSDELKGKKMALRTAMEFCDTKYILTFDADIHFQPDYFKSLEILDEAEMYVLPAILCGKSVGEKLYELDVLLANALNTGLSGISRPIFSSGANFLFKKDVFDEVDDFQSHAHMASGDDTYLLRDFRRNRKDIRLSSDLRLAIYTETPHSFREFIDQRLRWVGKTTDIKDGLATTSAMGQFFLSICFFSLLIICVSMSDLVSFVVLLGTKIGLDLLIFLPFFIRTRRILTWCLIPVYELLFPIYSIILGVLMLTYIPKWKGRKIHQRS